MLKAILLASSVVIAVPAFAQETPKSDTSQEQQAIQAQDQAATPVAGDQAKGQQDPATAAQANPQSTPAPAAQAAQPTPAQSTAQSDPASAQTMPAQPAQSTAEQPTQRQPAATQEQVAQVVGRDFGNYDKNSDGALSQAEFASWMGTLRKAAEPSFQPGTPEAETWAGQAFAAADADKSASVNKQELTVFLTPKQPS